MSRVKQKEFGDKFPSSEAILRLLGAGALLTMSMLVPAFPMIASAFLDPWKEFDRRRLRDQVNRLKKRKLLSITYDKKGEPIVKLSENGKLRLLRYKLTDLKIKKPKRWDKHWRLIIFDVSEKKRKLRDAFREMGKNLGFYQLQKSVFIYPYPCKNEIEFLRQIYGVGDDVLYMIVSDFEGKEDLKEHFGL